MVEYRITYSIERSLDGDEFEEIGFGSSLAWGRVNDALHDMASGIECREWETSGDMPEPEVVDGE